MKLSWRPILSSVIIIAGASLPALPVSAHEHGGDAAAGSGLSPAAIQVSVGSAIFVVLIIAAFLWQTRAEGRRAGEMFGMMAAMTVAMGSSLVVGTIGGLFLNHLFFATAIGVLFGMLVGYAAGVNFSLLAAMDGMLAGLMGGMMGAMLGVMTIHEYPALTILFMDAVFAVCMFVLYRALDQELVAADRGVVTEQEDTLSIGQTMT
ncbi:hypothetical protein [Paenibacillus methanolicus]|uniref:Uncharacterized protein n=1 Tax=Paenibacillus methanolicus TaxID=582686 RepID=A0A5S5CIK7_9BACL|nr:hypothetical protein [Paenibacillus methanolicus]TYP79354.1 hypothetical protein BCM02_101472 [Paenibacillus methanolicus]